MRTGRARTMRETKRARVARGLLAQIAAECYGFGVSGRTATPSPEENLRRAMAARTAGMRARYAQRGLASRTPLDRTTQAMLLRQLYLSRFEARRFHEARDVAEQAVELDVMSDVMLQDAARAAAIAEGDLAGAITHLRGATRRSPASRRIPCVDARGARSFWRIGTPKRSEP